MGNDSTTETIKKDWQIVDCNDDSKDVCITNDKVYKCDCGATLQKRKAENTYKEHTNVICDVCNKILPDNMTILHCPSQYVANIHPKGWDVCLNCVMARDNNKSDVNYHAVIIQAPLVSDASTKCSQDGVAFAKYLQTKLNYQHNNVHLISDSNVNIQYITETFGLLRKKLKKEDVVIVFVSGHGTCINFNYYFELGSDEKLKADDLQKMVLSDLTDYNVLFLINACYSGSFGKYISETSTQTCYVCYGGHTNGYQFECGHFCCGSCCANIKTKVCWMCKPKTAQSIFSSVKNNEAKNNLMAITSCSEKQESNFWYPMSPFVQYIIDGLKTGMDTPNTLMHYVQQQYAKPNKEIKISLTDLDQSLYSISYGNTDFLLSSA